MTQRERIIQLVGELPESELVVVERFVSFIRWHHDPVRAALDSAPEDDEPETSEEAAAVAAAKAELARGEGIPAAAVWKELLSD